MTSDLTKTPPPARPRLGLVKRHLLGGPSLRAWHAASAWLRRLESALEAPPSSSPRDAYPRPSYTKKGPGRVARIGRRERRTTRGDLSPEKRYKFGYMNRHEAARFVADGGPDG